MEWKRFGDVGVLLEFDTPAMARAWHAAIIRAEMAVHARLGWSTVLVTSKLSPSQLMEFIDTLAPDRTNHGIANEFLIEVTYNGEDLSAVAASTGLGEDEVIGLHSQPTYTVAFLGFSRGFPYLEGLDQRLWLPRRDSPRTRIPAGSVAIGAAQTGIYPLDSPGGWHLLGHTDVVLFDERCDPPSRVQPGDQVRFVPR